MKDIEALKQEHNYKTRSAEDVVARAEKADRALNDDEHKEIAELRAEAKAIAKEIEDIQKHEEVAAALKQERGITSTGRRSEPNQITNGEMPDDAGPRIEFARHSKLKAFTGPRAEERAYQSGMWTLANFYGNGRAARYCRENGLDTRALSEGVNTAGGALVPSVLADTMIDLRETYGVARQLAQIWPMGSDSTPVPVRTGSQTAYFTGEGVAGTESAPTFKNIELTPKKLMTYCLLSSELSEDAIVNLGDFIARDAAWALASKEDDCYFNGDGTATYGGIQGIVPKFEAATTYVGYVDAASGHDSLSEVDAADLSSLMGKLPQYARQSTCAWVCSQTASDVIFSRLKMSAGGNQIQTLQGGLVDTFLGYPIIVSQKMFATTTATSANNKVMVMFGNFSMASMIGSRREMRMQVSNEHKFLEDQVAIKVTERMDINIHSIGDATNAGPVVALIGAT